jgi:hypothetical protein
MYKTPTFAEPQQCNRPFSTGQVSAFIIQLVTWQVLTRSDMWCCINFPAYKTFSPVDILQGKIPRLYRKVTNFWILKIATDLHSNHFYSSNEKLRPIKYFTWVRPWTFHSLRDKTCQVTNWMMKADNWPATSVSSVSDTLPYEHRHLFLVFFFYLDTIYTTRYVTVHLLKNLGHRDFRVFSTRRTPAWRNGLHHLKLR